MSRTRRPNRRQFDYSQASVRPPIGIRAVAFNSDGGDDVIDLSLDDFCAVVPVSDAALLINWTFWRYTSPTARQRVFIEALEVLADSASGSNVRLRMQAEIGEFTGGWAIGIPTDQPYIDGRSGGKLWAVTDPNSPWVPPGGVNRYTMVANMGSAAANNWNLTNANLPGGNDVDITTNGISPFTIIGSGGWTCSDGNSVNSVSDQGGGVLRLGMSNGPASGHMIAIAGSNPDIIDSAGNYASPSWVLL